MLLGNGANEAYIDNGNIAEEVRRRHPEGFNKILDLVCYHLRFHFAS
jgi:hypothetical protein